MLLNPIKYAMGNASRVDFVDPNTNYPKKGFDYFLFFILTAIIVFLSLLKPMVNLIRFAKSSSDEINPVKQPSTTPKENEWLCLTLLVCKKTLIIYSNKIER